jgi:hypothetical protein
MQKANPLKKGAAKERIIFSSLFAYFLPFSFLLLPSSVSAAPGVMGVVKSQTNATQWEGITGAWG